MGVFKPISRVVQQVRGVIQPPQTPGSLIASCIRSEEGEFVFYLNPLMVNQIESVRFSGDRLMIPPRQLARLVVDLKQLAILDGQTWSRIQSALTFKTFYVGYDNQQGKFLLRTVLSPDGDIINQVNQELLDQPEGLRIAQSHNWLIGELLSFLKLRTTQLIDRLAWAIAFFTVWLPDAIFTVRNLILILQNPSALREIVIPLALGVGLPVLLGIVIGFLWHEFLLRQMIALAPRLKAWALRELFTPKPTFTKRIAKEIWGRFAV